MSIIKTRILVFTTETMKATSCLFTIIGTQDIVLAIKFSQNQGANKTAYSPALIHSGPKTITNNS